MYTRDDTVPPLSRTTNDLLPPLAPMHRPGTTRRDARLHTVAPQHPPPRTRAVDYAADGDVRGGFADGSIVSVGGADASGLRARPAAAAGEQELAHQGGVGRKSVSPCDRVLWMHLFRILFLLEFFFSFLRFFLESGCRAFL